jgi:hypothetical protein
MSALSISENRLIDLINRVLDGRLPSNNNGNTDHGTAASYNAVQHPHYTGRNKFSGRRDYWRADRGERDIGPRFNNYRRQLSSDTEDGRLVQSLNLHVRTVHAIGNWGNDTAPRSIRGRLTDVYDSVYPPGCDESFRAAIRSMQDRHQAELANLVEFTLRDKLETVSAKIKLLNQNHRARAEETVRHQLRNLRITPEALDEALAATRVPAPIVSSEQQLPPATDQLSRRQPLPSADTRTDDITDQPPTPPLDTVRRDPPTRSPSPSPRRQRRSSPGSSSSAAQQPPAARTPSTSPRRLPRSSPASSSGVGSVTQQPSAPRPPFFHVGGGRQLVIEKTSDDGWNFKLLPSRTVATIVIADSNGKRWRSVPDDWLVLVCPGAKLQDVQSIVESIRMQRSVTTIVLAVGANNRTEARFTLEDAMKRLCLFTSQFISVDVCFFGVPSLDRSSPLEEEGAKLINQLANHLWPANYISVPAEFPVRYINPNDVFHYNENTADRYILAVQNFIQSL